MRTMLASAAFVWVLFLVGIHAATDLSGPYYAEKSVTEMEYKTLVELHEKVAFLQLDAELELELFAADFPDDKVKRRSLEKRVEILSVKIAELRKRMLLKQLE